MSTASIAGLLAGALPDDTVRTDDTCLSEHSVSGRRPAAVVCATEATQVVTTLQLASEQGLAVSPRGGGSMLDLGNPIERLDLVIDLCGLNAVVDYQPDDLTLTVQAGVIVGDIHRLLERRGQSLPLDVPLPDRATIGGALATNAHGPRRLKYGTARDLVIGMQVVQPLDGLVRSGGKVVKNVAGYDLAKLHIGGLGTAGVITEITFKLWPAPAASAGVIASFASVDSAVGTALQVIHGQLFPAAIELVSPVAAERMCAAFGAEVVPGHWLLAALLSGVPAAVRRQTHEISAICTATGSPHPAIIDDGPAGRLFARLRDFGRSLDDPASLILRTSVLPSQSGHAAAIIEDSTVLLGRQPELLIRPGSGSLFACWSGLPSDRIGEAIRSARAALVQIGGGLVVERCPMAVSGSVEAWDLDGRDLAMMQRLKQTYDPNATLNPGRYVGRI